MKFESISKETVLLNPRKSMARESIPSEIRKDPLTGRTARICHFMALNWPKTDFDQLVGDTGKTCPFCPERIMDVTPSFPDDILKGGRLVSGDMVLFPNLAPYDGLSAVAVMSGRHFIPMLDITPEIMAKAFAFSLDFFRRIHATGHPESVYHIVNWNYMPPSGSSILHPHLQVFVSSTAPNLMREELEAASAYRNENGSNYWVDLVETEEKSGKRFLGRIGRTAWMMAYAPMGVAGDVVAVVDGAHSTLDLSEQDLLDLAQGFSHAIAAYDKMGIFSFNMNFFTGAVGDKTGLFHAVFSPRIYFNKALGTPDVGALRHLYNESLCMAFPEDIATRLRPFYPGA